MFDLGINEIRSELKALPSSVFADPADDYPNDQFECGIDCEVCPGRCTCTLSPDFCDSDTALWVEVVDSSHHDDPYNLFGDCED